MLGRRHGYYYIFLLFGTLILLTFVSNAYAEILVGKVVGVHDGDTLTLLTDENQRVKVRLAEIDAPELGQPYGRQAKKVLSDLVFGKLIRVDSLGTDRYGRVLGRVFVGGLYTVNVNEAVVSAGAAWVYRRYSDNPVLLAQEADAGASGRGLWGLPESQQIPPWEWR